MNPKEKLKKKIFEISKEGKNLKILYEYFGEENIKNLPFESVLVKGFKSEKWRESYQFYVNLQTGKVRHKLYDDSISLSDPYYLEKLEMIEEAIHERLEGFNKEED